MTFPWALFAVELGVCAWILLLLAAPAERTSSLWLVALAGVIVALGLLSWQRAESVSGIFQQVFAVDGFSGYFKGLFLLTAGVVIVMTREFSGPSARLQHAGAFYMLLFTALLGTLVLASTNDLLLLFLGVELLTFSLYIMTAYLKSDARSIEAGMKYLIMGSVSSGFLVYGLALLYGVTGSMTFPAIRDALATQPPTLAVQAGVLLVLAGLGFKIAAVPFHWWVPDVYEGAPTPVVAFLSVGSKMAGIVALTRVLYGAFLPLQPFWAPVLSVLSAVTMCYGNLAALPQTNIKRLLGYSSIGHAGYLLMAISTGSAGGIQAVAYYLLAYLFSNLAVFLVVVAASEGVGGEALDDYKGLAKRSGVLAASLFIGLLSLAGVPPLAGFVGKLLVLLRTVESQRLWLVAIGAVNVAISLYYYLMIVKRMYLDTPKAASPIPVSRLTKVVLAALVLGIFAAGIWPEPFLQRIIASIH